LYCANQSTVFVVWSHQAIAPWPFRVRPSHSAARFGWTGVWLSLKSTWPVIVSFVDGRHWKSGPTTRLWPPPRISRSVPSRLT
jgi:hypothetical protein